MPRWILCSSVFVTYFDILNDTKTPTPYVLPQAHLIWNIPSTRDTIFYLIVAFLLDCRPPKAWAPNPLSILQWVMFRHPKQLPQHKLKQIACAQSCLWCSELTCHTGMGGRQRWVVAHEAVDVISVGENWFNKHQYKERQNSPSSKTKKWIEHSKHQPQCGEHVQCAGTGGGLPWTVAEAMSDVAHGWCVFVCVC